MFKNLWSKIFTLIGILIVTLVAAGHTLAAPLGGSPSVTLSSLSAGDTANYTIDFITSASGAIPAGGKINIDFPSGFNAAGAHLGIHSANLGINPGLAINGQSISVTIDQNGAVANSSAVSIQLLGVINHQTVGNYKLIVSTSNLGVIIDGPTNSSNFNIQPNAPSNIDFSPSGSQDVSADDHQLFITATVTDEFGNNVANGTRIHWQSSNANFSFESVDDITITNNGQTTATLNAPTMANQVTSITASSGVVSDPYTVTVVPGDLHHIIITPSDSVTTLAGQAVQFIARAYDEWNNIRVTDTFTWEGTESINSGKFSETVAGQYQVWAMSNGIESNHIMVTVIHSSVDYLSITPADIHLTNADMSQAYSVFAFDLYNNFWNPSMDPGIQFSTSDPKGKFIGNIYYAGKIGTWTINASYGGKSVSTNVSIDFPGKAANIVLSNPVAHIDVNSIYQFNVKVYDADGNEIINPIINWNVILGYENAIIDSFGKFMATKLANYQIRAQYGDLILVSNFAVVAPSQPTATFTETKTTSAVGIPTAVVTEEPKEEIKGTEISTIGANNENNTASSKWPLVSSIVIGALILLGAYFAYYYLGSDAPLTRTEKADKIVENNHKVNVKEPEDKDASQRRW